MPTVMRLRCTACRIRSPIADRMTTGIGAHRAANWSRASAFGDCRSVTYGPSADGVGKRPVCDCVQRGDLQPPGVAGGGGAGLPRRDALRNDDSVAWRGHSDTETLLAGIEAWGLEATLKKSIGMFAIALWDREANTLTLARDRIGEKPLYYGWQGSGEQRVKFSEGVGGSRTSGHRNNNV